MFVRISQIRTVLRRFDRSGPNVFPLGKTGDLCDNLALVGVLGWFALRREFHPFQKRMAQFLCKCEKWCRRSSLIEEIPSVQNFE